ncbi:hypothetical protein Ancab_009872 [Ancistrocladus abbreviatus]
MMSAEIGDDDRRGLVFFVTPWLHGSLGAFAIIHTQHKGSVLRKRFNNPVSYSKRDLFPKVHEGHRLFGSTVNDVCVYAAVQSAVFMLPVQLASFNH